MITNHNFFLEILKAVCLSVDWVQKLIQNFINHGAKISLMLWDWGRCRCLQCLLNIFSGKVDFIGFCNPVLTSNLWGQSSQYFRYSLIFYSRHRLPLAILLLKGWVKFLHDIPKKKKIVLWHFLVDVIPI